MIWEYLGITHPTPPTLLSSYDRILKLGDIELEVLTRLVTMSVILW